MKPKIDQGRCKSQQQIGEYPRKYHYQHWRRLLTEVGKKMEITFHVQDFLWGSEGDGWTACKCGRRGWATYWLNLWTANVMSGLDKVRCNRLPMMRQYWVWSDTSVKKSGSLWSIGIEAGLQAKKPESSRRKRIFLLWHKNSRTSCNFMPRKYLREPRSRILKVLLMACFRESMSRREVPMIMSSTYSRNA